MSLELPSEDHYRGFQDLALKKLGLSLGSGKGYLLQGRLQRRMSKLGLDDYGDYLRLISSDSGEEELQHFVNAITTTKTDFFENASTLIGCRRRSFPPLSNPTSRAVGKRFVSGAPAVRQAKRPILWE